MEQPPAGMVVFGSDGRFNQNLASWFAARAGVWSGTASELLAAVGNQADPGDGPWPDSPRACYTHLETCKQALRSLGVDVAVRQALPRMITLRPWQEGERTEAPPPVTVSGKPLPSQPNPDPSPVFSDLPEVTHRPTAQDRSASDPDTQVQMPNAQNTNLQVGDTPNADQIAPATITSDTVTQDVPIPKPDLHEPVVNEQLVNRKYSGGDTSEGRVFENTGDALVAFGEMRVLIREQGVDLKSAIEVVVGRTKEVTRSSGVAVGMLRQERLVYIAQKGILAPIAAPHFQAEFFRSCLKAGEVFHLRDAQQHPLVGRECRQEGIRSLIVVPIFHAAKIVGVFELLFSEPRSFSMGDVMDVELIASVVSEVVGRIAENETELAGEFEYEAPQEVVTDAERPQRPSSTAGGFRIEPLAASSPAIAPATLPARSPGTPNRLWQTIKRGWVSLAGAK